SASVSPTVEWGCCPRVLVVWISKLPLQGVLFWSQRCILSKPTRCLSPLSLLFHQTSDNLGGRFPIPISERPAMFCSKCGATVADTSTVCAQCGAQMTPQPSLQNYGQPLSDARTDGKATTSMILGILSLLLCIFGFLAGIPAIILGHISRSNI